MSAQMPQQIPGGGIDLSHLARQHNPAPVGAAGVAGAAGAAPAPNANAASATPVDVPALVVDVTDATFEQIAQLSNVVPVVFDLWAQWCQPCKTLSPIIEQVTLEFGGKILLGKVDVDANPGLAQAFQAQSIPTVVALVAGRPVPLFQGALPVEQVREFFGKLLELAAQHGVAGQLNAPELSGDPAAQDALAQEPEVPAAHVAALSAQEAGDYAQAVQEWEQVLLKNPADQAARTNLAQSQLLLRLSGAVAAELRENAAAAPHSVAAQLAVADLDMAGGHVSDACQRLLEIFSAGSGDERGQLRERLLQYFEIAGAQDPRVAQARGQLANLLY